MGRVWLARDEVLHRDVAIKELVPPAGLTADERAGDARALAARGARDRPAEPPERGAHLRRAARRTADPWIVMEYVPSRSLQDVHRAATGRCRRAGPPRSAWACWPRCGAAHRAGVRAPRRQAGQRAARRRRPGGAHRLRPGHGRRATRNVTRTGLVLGSPAYIAPERARDGTAGPGGRPVVAGRDAVRGGRGAVAVRPAVRDRHAGRAGHRAAAAAAERRAAEAGAQRPAAQGPGRADRPPRAERLLGGRLRRPGAAVAVGPGRKPADQGNRRCSGGHPPPAVSPGSYPAPLPAPAPAKGAASAPAPAPATPHRAARVQRLRGLRPPRHKRALRRPPQAPRPALPPLQAPRPAPPPLPAPEPARAAFTRRRPVLAGRRVVAAVVLAGAGTVPWFTLRDGRDGNRASRTRRRPHRLRRGPDHRRHTGHDPGRRTPGSLRPRAEGATSPPTTRPWPGPPARPAGATSGATALPVYVPKHPGEVRAGARRPYFPTTARATCSASTRPRSRSPTRSPTGGGKARYGISKGDFPATTRIGSSRCGTGGRPRREYTFDGGAARHVNDRGSVASKSQAYGITGGPRRPLGGRPGRPATDLRQLPPEAGLGASLVQPAQRSSSRAMSRAGNAASNCARVRGPISGTSPGRSVQQPRQYELPRRDAQRRRLLAQHIQPRVGVGPRYVHIAPALRGSSNAPLSIGE